MNRKHFVGLLATVLVVALVLLLVPGRTGKQAGLEQTHLLPDLQQKVNDIDWLRITGPGGVTVATLARKDGRWVVSEAGGYAADWGRVKALLSSLAQAVIVEPKTANPQYYSRLGVEDVSRDNAGGVQVEFAEATGLPAVILGKRAQKRSGQYARIASSAESALLDREVDVSPSRTEWLQRTIIDIPAAEVVEVRIEHPDGNVVLARKTSADDKDFRLENVPEGRAAKSDFAVNSLANALASLRLDGVEPDDGKPWPGALKIRVLTADGLLVEGEAMEREEPVSGGETAAGAPEKSFWLRLQASVYRTAVGGPVEADGAGGDADDAQSADKDTAGRAAEINRRTRGWAYRIPQYKYEAMDKRLDDLLKDESS